MKSQKSNVRNADVNLYLDWCSYKAAKYAVSKWHYSKRMPVGKMIKIGVWESSNYIGVLIFSLGNNMNLGKFVGLDQFKICELTRIALRAHITPVTKIVKIAIALLKVKSPKIEAIISYADPEQGHLGKIYQAGNWIYLGRSSKSKVYNLNGIEIHSRTANSGNVQFGRKSKTPVGIERAKIVYKEPKHKYIMPLTKELKKKCMELKKPYPRARAEKETGLVSS